MVQINFALKEVNCKIVFYGPGMSGKTTNLEVVHQKAPEENKGELTSISTDGDRTLFFDFMPLDLGNVAGMRTKFQLYTVPGQVYYNSTRKLVLQGVDGVIFVADSDPEKMDENIESYENLVENLREYGKDIREVPHVLQYNKRDLPSALPVAEMDRMMNRFGVLTFEAVAATGEGVFPTLKVLAGMVLESIDRGAPGERRRPATAGAAAAPATGGAARPTASRQPQRAAAAPRGGGRPTTVNARGGRQAAAAPATRGGGRPTAAPPAPQRGATQRAAPPARAARAAAPRAANARPEAPAKAAGSGLLVMVAVLLVAAVAGVVYFIMQNPE